MVTDSALRRRAWLVLLLVAPVSCVAALYAGKVERDQSIEM